MNRAVRALHAKAGAKSRSIIRRPHESRLIIGFVLFRLVVLGLGQQFAAVLVHLQQGWIGFAGFFQFDFGELVELFIRAGGDAEAHQRAAAGQGDIGHRSAVPGGFKIEGDGAIAGLGDGDVMGILPLEDHLGRRGVVLAIDGEAGAGGIGFDLHFLLGAAQGGAAGGHGEKGERGEQREMFDHGFICSER